MNGTATDLQLPLSQLVYQDMQDTFGRFLTLELVYVHKNSTNTSLRKKTWGKHFWRPGKELPGNLMK
jgi:hypothetical protein